MSFKLQLTEEMTRFLLGTTITDEEAGLLIRILAAVAYGDKIPTKIPQPLTHVVPIFVGQIDYFRANYERKKQDAIERQRRRRAKLSGLSGEDDDPNEARDMRDKRDPNEARDMRDMRDKRDPNEARDMRDKRDPNEARDMRDMRDKRDPNEARDMRDKRDPNEARDMRDKRDPNEARDMRDKRDPNEARDMRDKRDNVCHANTTPYHTTSYQTTSTEPNAHARNGIGFVESRIGVDSYDDIFSVSHDPVDLALSLCQDSKPRSATSAYRRQLTRIGEDAFRSVLAKFWGEVRAGEEPRSRGAAFMARLKKEETIDPEEAEEARAACAALAKKASTKGKTHE